MPKIRRIAIHNFSGGIMEINQIPVPNPEPNPVLSQNQRYILSHMKVDPIETKTSAARKVLEAPQFLKNFGASKSTGTPGSLIDILI